MAGHLSEQADAAIAARYMLQSRQANDDFELSEVLQATWFRQVPLPIETICCGLGYLQQMGVKIHPMIFALEAARIYEAAETTITTSNIQKTSWTVWHMIN